MLLLLLACAHPTAPTFDLNATIPVDPDVRQGRLENGLTWYVDPNAKPEDRAELWLVVKAGSVFEDPDQRGLAHLVEHMAFNGTRNFPANTLISYMESIGMSFGAHLNAYTTYDRTVYTLTVPTDTPEALSTGLRVLRDWGDGLLFDPAEIEKERGVVLEELRTRLGAGQRIGDQLQRTLFSGSLYAERSPIGTEESLKGFDPAALKRFYTDWYRPELMAVIAVGDFDPAVVASSVQESFGSMTSPANPRPVPTIPVPTHPPVTEIITDPELPQSVVVFQSVTPEPERNDWAGYRESLVESLVYMSLNERFGACTQSPDCPYLGAGGGEDRLTAELTVTQLQAGVQPGKEAAAVQALQAAVLQARQYGFSEDEIRRAAARLASGYASLEKDVANRTSNDRAEELVRVFMFGETLTIAEQEAAFALSTLENIDAGTVSAAAADLLRSDRYATSLIMPTSAPPVDTATLQGWLDAAPALVQAPTDTATTVALLEALPSPGKVVARSEVAPLGVTRWTLSNGVEVWIKPTDFKQDEVLVRAVSKGGIALSGAEWPSVVDAPVLRSLSGLGAHDPVTLGNLLAGQRADAGANFTRWSERVWGNASPDHLETMFQLIYLLHTAPRFTENGLALYRLQAEQGLQARQIDPASRFNEAMSRLLWQDNPRMLSYDAATIAGVNLTDAERYYTARLSDADDFIYVIVGNVDLKKLEPLVERYLGSLPARPEADAVQDDGARLRPTAGEVVVRAGQEPKAQVAIHIPGEFSSNWISRNRIQSLASILEVRLRERLREGMSGTYGVGVGVNTWEAPMNAYDLSIYFQCDPARVDELKAAVWEEVARLRDAPITETELETEKEKNRRERELSVQSNGFWAGSISDTLMRGEDPLELLTYDQRNNSLSVAELQQVAQQYLRQDRAVVGVLLPAEPAP